MLQPEKENETLRIRAWTGAHLDRLHLKDPWTHRRAEKLMPQRSIVFFRFLPKRRQL